MEPGSVIEQFDVLEDGRPRCFSIRERTAIIDFKLQIGEETLNHCVVVGHAWPAHAQYYFGFRRFRRFRRFCTVLRASVLAALIVMKGQPRSGRVASQRHFKGIHRKFGELLVAQ